jgi:hypothetical protein
VVDNVQLQTNMSSSRTLSEVLDNEAIMDTIEDEKDIQSYEQSEEAPMKGLCIECGDQPISLHCEQCADDYCEVCFQALHKRGNRKNHVTKSITKFVVPSSNQSTPQTPQTPIDQNQVIFVPVPLVGAAPSDIAERSKFIPVRLSASERKALRLLEAAIRVSEYTDKVDIISFKSKTQRIFTQVKDVCAILSGLVVASDYNVGQQLVKERNFKDNEKFFRQIFEIGRRHKIMNPEKMRSEYGKLLYMLMDTNLSEVQELMGFSCIKPIKMVYRYLEKRNVAHMLSDEYIVPATVEIIADNKTRDEVQREIKTKERAIEYLAKKYTNEMIEEEELKQCLYSIGDNNAFLRQSRDSCDEMLNYLQSLFSPDSIEEGYSLAIRSGVNGHRLTHSHASQYHYVYQSLSLWREVLHDMFKLWFFCESDLLDTGDCPYRLRDTGQGLNRVQSCPRIGKAMRNILYKVQQRVGENWVGSSVIHLGDHNVPNALMFIDKYSQVPRILNPIVTTLRLLPQIARDENIGKYIESTFGGVERLTKEILSDFFKGGFDGSGADNFFDAGSCIDGRLTSAWNWCSKIEKKRFFPVFLLTGFTGFDGDFAAG